MKLDHLALVSALTASTILKAVWSQDMVPCENSLASASCESIFYDAQYGLIEGLCDSSVDAIAPNCYLCCAKDFSRYDTINDLFLRCHEGGDGFLNAWEDLEPTEGCPISVARYGEMCFQGVRYEINDLGCEGCASMSISDVEWVTFPCCGNVILNVAQIQTGCGETDTLPPTTPSSEITVPQTPPPEVVYVTAPPEVVYVTAPPEVVYVTAPPEVAAAPSRFYTSSAISHAFWFPIECTALLASMLI